MKKTKMNIGLEGGVREDLRVENIERKRVNVVLKEDVHKKAVIFAAKGGWDFSEFVNLMLETFLYPGDKEVFEVLLKGMLATEVRKRGFTIAKDALQLKGEQSHRKLVKKGKK